MDSFYTVVKTETWEQVIDKSRFIGIVLPVSSIAEVEANLAKVRETYPNARHYVYAYRLREGYLEKSTDDGEPQGTGGRPVLDLLQYRQVWNVLLVVARYFGGILLGAGGLTRAYGGTARQVLDKAELTLLVPHIIYGLKVSYSWYETLKYQFRLHSWETGKEEFGIDVYMEVFIPWEEREQFTKWLNDFTQSQVNWKEVEVTLRPKS